MRKKKREGEEYKKKVHDPAEPEKETNPTAEDADGIAEYTARLAKCMEILMRKK